MGVANQEQQNLVKRSQQQQNLQIQRQLSTLQSSRPKTHDKIMDETIRKEYSDFNVPRSGINLKKITLIHCKILSCLYVFLVRIIKITYYQ